MIKIVIGVYICRHAGQSSHIKVGVGPSGVPPYESCVVSAKVVIKTTDGIKHFGGSITSIY